MHNDFLILRIDLSRRKGIIEKLEPNLMEHYFGGTGLGAKILWDETTATTSPFSPENRLMFMIGPLTGKVPQGSRYAVCGLSPANEAWGEATGGGRWGLELSRTGLIGIVFEGRSETPVYLYAADDGFEIKDAHHLWGKDTYETTELLQREHGKEACVACIGQAGEKQARIASVMSEGRIARAAARCGMGAVMGSKNLKAVVVKGTQGKQSIVDKAKLNIINREVSSRLVKIKKGEGGGVPSIVDLIALWPGLCNMPLKNQSMAREGADWFVRELTRTYPKKVMEPYKCEMCPVGCVESDMYKGSRGVVGEALLPIGSNCMIADFTVLQEAYELCNRYGLDAISVGDIIAFAMELYEKGIINKKDTGDIALTWGSEEALIEIIKQIGERRGFGEILGEGVKRAAQAIGGDAHLYAMHVKGLEIALHDPRIWNSLMIGYATGNRGASHIESHGYALERKHLGNVAYGVDGSELGFPPGKMQRLGFEGKAELVVITQDLVASINALLICDFAYFIYGVQISTHIEWLKAVTGWDIDFSKFMQTGERIFNLKRLINFRRGLTSKDDTLPQRMLTRRPDAPPDIENVPDSLSDILQQYYKARGWDTDGKPTKSKLKELGLVR